MNLDNRVAVVTGGANGIGRALCVAFHRCGAKVVVVDTDGANAASIARDINGLAIQADVSLETDIVELVRSVEAEFGRIDLFCSNAGISIEGGEEVPNSAWDRIFSVNVMAHIYAARAVLPGMLARGEGYLLQTASAAGLLSQIGSAPYAVTKHAALAYAEWLSITYGDRGIRVSALCPQGVRTNMLANAAGGESFLLQGAIEPEAVAEAVVEGIREERFLILPHPEVAEYFRRKATDYDRWLRGMRRLQASVAAGTPKVENRAMTTDTILKQPIWNFEQEPFDAGEDPDETSFNLRAYFDRMADEKLLTYRRDWSDEQLIEWDGNFTTDGTLLIACSERDVDVEEYRRVMEQNIAYRDRVRGLLV